MAHSSKKQTLKSKDILEKVKEVLENKMRAIRPSIHSQKF